MVKAKKPGKAEIIKQVARLRSLPPGLADPDQIDVRIASIRTLMEERARSSEHLVKIIDRCVLELKWVPVPADVAEIIRQIDSDTMPFWEAPQKPGPMTDNELREEIQFQETFAKRYPNQKAAAVERIDWAKYELAKRGVV